MKHSVGNDIQKSVAERPILYANFLLFVSFPRLEIEPWNSRRKFAVLFRNCKIESPEGDAWCDSRAERPLFRRKGVVRFPVAERPFFRTLIPGGLWFDSLPRNGLVLAR